MVKAMKGKMFLEYSIIFLIFCFSCNNSGMRILKKGLIYKYAVVECRNNKRELLGHLFLQESQSILSLLSSKQISIEWSGSFVFDSSKIKYKEITLARDDTKEYSLHPPRNSFFSFTEVPPFPSIDMPPEVGASEEIEMHVIKYNSFKKGFLNNKIINQELIVKNKIDTIINGIPYHNCYYSIGRNLNYIKELGTYYIETWYVQNKGFILIKYTKPNKDLLELILQN